jgi:hypothetical protein
MLRGQSGGEGECPRVAVTIREVGILMKPRANSVVDVDVVNAGPALIPLKTDSSHIAR